MEIWVFRLVGIVLLGISAFGFLNALVLKHHGPGGDLGVVAAILALGAFACCEVAAADK